MDIFAFYVRESKITHSRFNKVKFPYKVFGDIATFLAGNLRCSNATVDIQVIHEKYSHSQGFEFVAVG